MARADYRILSISSDQVILRDLDLGNVSVTNDADAVVEEVARNYPNRRIFYHDSSGDFAELVHDNGSFSHFAPA